MNDNVIGRFAPTPSGRMHLGNVFAALLSYVSPKSRDGAWILRMEDLDTQRTRAEYARLLREDLLWLGLKWDEETQPQSLRSDVYGTYVSRLRDMELLYPCYCTRSQLHSPNAPHLSDGTYVYTGTCRNLTPEERAAKNREPAWRVIVPEKIYTFTDLIQGEQDEELSRECGDFIVRRADGAYVYQLAVVVDDGEAGVTEVVRGWDLLGSAARQMYLQDLFAFDHPQYAHIPLLVAPDGRRLSKRDKDLDLGAIRQRIQPEKLIGILASSAGLLEKPEPISADELATIFTWDKIKGKEIQVSNLEQLY